jgi:peptide/nickel transport system substrate-binding protein
MSILPAAAAASGRGAAPLKSPVSAGPYKLEGGTGQNELTLVRNDAYSGPKPVAERLVFSTIDDSVGRFSQLEGGQVDVVRAPPIERLASLPASIENISAPTFGLTMLSLNNTKAPFDDRQVRLAVAEAVDRAQISEVAWQGLAKPVAGPLPLQFSGSRAVLPTTPDPKKARATLAASHCGIGCHVSIIAVSSQDWARSSAVVVQQSLQAAGFDVSLESMDQNSALERLDGLNYTAIVVPVSDYSEAPNGVPALTLLSTGGWRAAFTGYDSPAMDAAVRAAQVAPTIADRLAAYDRVNTTFGKDVPWVPLTDFPTLAAAKSQVKGLVQYSPTGFLEVATKQQ